MKTPSTISHNRSKPIYLFLIGIMTICIWLVSSTYDAQAGPGVLDVTLYAPSGEPLNAYNLIVDSNVTATSTGAPNVATVAVRFCNTGTAFVDDDLTNVWGYIGDGATPGTYPIKVPSDFNSLPGGNSFTDAGGAYSFTHVGAASDASRFIGTLPAGECSVQYWHFTYPQCETVGGAAAYPPCTNSPTWGDSVNADDDMSLNFQVWGSAYDGFSTVTDNETWTMWMRNEISAMANKIKPNPDGIWFNTDTSVVYPGETITTNGIKYEFGNINQGFDNSIDSDGDGVPDPAGQDGVPDYNAWAQPVGTPSYDPRCFQLIKTETELTVSRSSGLGELTLNYTDQLYYTNLPANNTGVRGEVRYTFLALDGACFSGLSPYQEVASGSDNEKFNGDYGTGIPPLQSFESQVGIDKSSTPNIIPTGTTTEYTLPFWNSGTKDAGLTLSTGGAVDAPLVIKDTVPDGMEYVCGSAQATTDAAVGGVTIYYSNDSGLSWSTDESSICTGVDPTSNAGGNEIVIQWWLNGPLPSGATGTNNYAQFQARVPSSGYIGPDFIENCATSHFGPNGPAFDEACDTLMVEGTNSIGDYVWADVDTDGVQDASETGINAITVWLYWDKNNDGVLDDDETMPIATTSTYTHITEGDGYYEFIDLPDASYIVKVDGNDPQLPAGYNYTTPKEVAVTSLSGGVDGTLTEDEADFGFGPILDLTKSLTNGEYDDGNYDNLYQGQLANYTINVINTRPGGTGPSNFCQHVVWATTAGSSGNANSQWQNTSAAIGADDSVFTYTEMANASDDIDLGGYFIGMQAGNITNVQYVMYVKELLDLDADDSMDVLITNAGTVYDSTTPAPGDFDGVYFAAQTVGEVFLATIDLGTTLDWPDFDGAATNPLNVNIVGNRGGGTSGELALDAAAFIITTDEICGDPADTMNPVPLTDTYNPAELEFVSANPPVSSQTPAGTLTWNNVGSLEAGEVQSIEVIFKVLASSGVVNNAAATTGAKYLDGRPANDVNDDVDADVFDAHVIGDYVWFDTNGDGNQGAAADEPGLAGVVVELYFRGGSNQTVFYNGVIYNDNDLIATTTTDANGAYLFEGVLSEDYEVVVNTAASPVLAALTATTIEADSVALSADYLDADFGYNGASIVYGSVWHDKNADASQAGEDFIAGVTVYLSDGSCTLGTNPATDCPETTTDENGRFQFTNVPDGSYSIIVNPPGTQVSEPTGEDLTDTCVNTGTCSNSYDITVTGPGAFGGYDFGYTGSDIGDSLYVDWDGNGLQDESVGPSSPEEGIPNINVYLYNDINSNGIVDAEDKLLETDVTDSFGQYLFVNYPAGNYLVVADTGDPDFPAGYIITADPDATFDSRHAFAFGGITPKLDVDFGYQPQGAGYIGDFVWKDVNGDGFYNPNGLDGISGNSDDETPIAGISVTLYEDTNGNGSIDPEDAVIDDTIETDANGNYLFSNLSTTNKNYIVQVDDTDADLPAGFSFPSTPTTVAVNLTNANPDYLDADFGFTGPARVGDYIWLDTNGDGEQDPSESGIDGVTVNLHTFTYIDGSNGGIVNGRWDWGESTTLSAAPIATMLTTVNPNDATQHGYYQFTGLTAGDYAVVVTPPANHTNTGDPDAIACNVGCDNQTYFHLDSGQADMSRDFGYRPEVPISGTVFFDTNDDGGIYSSGANADSPFANVTVYLYDDGGALYATTTTDANGFYQFYVPDGGAGGTEYEVRYDTFSPSLQGMDQNYEPTIAVPAVAVPPNAGDTGYCGSSAATCNDRATLTVTGNTPVTNQDFGFFANMDCGDLPEAPMTTGDFNTSLSRSGACHIIVDHYLGTAGLPDAEIDGQADTLAGNYASTGGDDNNGINDEDGVSRVSGEFWEPGNTVHVDVDVVGANAFLVGWFDWNGDGVFGAGEQVRFGAVPAGSTQSLSVNIPSSYVTGTSIMTRFRLYEGAPPIISPAGQVYNGEVEDYYWQFGPTAVSLSSFTANASSSSVIGFVSIILAALFATGSVLFFRRKGLHD